MTLDTEVRASARRNWSQAEVEETVEDYFAMYAAELGRQTYNKSSHRRALLARLDGRNDRAVEEKHRNISAVLAEQGLPFIDGYRPRFHYQQLLKEAVLARLGRHPELLESVEDIPAVAGPDVIDWATALVLPPPRSDVASRPRITQVVPGRDYVALQRENSALGRFGEEFVVSLEQRRLSDLGRIDLAAKVERVSSTRGDGLGFDVLSFREDGSELHIEVKTTKYGAGTPFFVSAREESYSREQPGRFCLYRVFDWPDAKVFTLEGPLEQHFGLTPSTFKAVR